MRVKDDHWAVLLDFCEKYPQIVTNKFNGSQSRTQQQQLWEEITMLLNSLGHGTKTVEEWRKTLTDWKSKTKAKAVKDVADATRTGGGSRKTAPLNIYELRLLQLMGKTAVEGDVAVRGIGLAKKETPARTHSFPQNQLHLTANNGGASIPLATPNSVVVHKKADKNRERESIALVHQHSRHFVSQAGVTEKYEREDLPPTQKYSNQPLTIATSNNNKRTTTTSYEHPYYKTPLCIAASNNERGTLPIAHRYTANPLGIAASNSNERERDNIEVEQQCLGTESPLRLVPDCNDEQRYTPQQPPNKKKKIDSSSRNQENKTMEEVRPKPITEMFEESNQKIVDCLNEMNSNIEKIAAALQSLPKVADSIRSVAEHMGQLVREQQHSKLARETK